MSNLQIPPTIVSNGNLAVNVAGEILCLNGLTRCAGYQRVSGSFTKNDMHNDKSQQHHVAEHFLSQAAGSLGNENKLLFKL